ICAQYLFYTAETVAMIERSIRRKPADRARKQCIRKFLYYFKKGYQDPTYIAWERQYKLDAHYEFQEALNRKSFAALLKSGNYQDVAMTAVRIESRTNLLFSFEKMALRDAIKVPEGAKAFATGLYDYLYGSGSLEQRFLSFRDIVGELPRRQTRVLTWPLLTVFGFIGNPHEHMFLKPRVTQVAAEKYAFDFYYKSRPNWDTYQSLLDFAAQVRADTRMLKPADYIDLQSFIWVMGSDEYPD
ncbi:MAG TPA: hypothetical protein VFZ78_01525, partial [Flavisolibacter sp.]